MAVNIVTLPEPESETKQPKLTTPKNNALAIALKSLAILRCMRGSRIVLLGVDTGKFGIPVPNISQENDQGILIIKYQSAA